jgi:hypothetical protein
MSEDEIRDEMIAGWTLTVEETSHVSPVKHVKKTISSVDLMSALKDSPMLQKVREMGKRPK